MQVIHTYVIFYFLKYLFYSQIHRYLQGSDMITCFKAALIVAFVTGNVLCIVIGVKNTTTLSKRLRQMSTINLISLTLRGHINLIVNYCSIKVKNYQHVHQWLRWVIIVEGLMYFVMTAAALKPDLYTFSWVTALMIWNLIISAWAHDDWHSSRLSVWWQPFLCSPFLLYVNDAMRSLSSLIQFWLSLSLLSLEFTASYLNLLLLQLYICLLSLISLYLCTFSELCICSIKMSELTGLLVKSWSNTWQMFFKFTLKSCNHENFTQGSMSTSACCEWHTWHLLKLIHLWSSDGTVMWMTTML